MSKPYDIHERIFNFVINVVKFVNKIPRTPTNLIFIGQITRSVTSVGANDQEADGTTTKKDFLHNYTTVRKELKETVYWLRVISKINEPFAPEGENLISEGNELTAIVSTIMKNASNHEKDHK
jgi:four helix bundle protein